MPKKRPVPIPKSANIAKARSAYAMKKIKSVDVSKGLKIPLSETDADFQPRDRKPELEMHKAHSRKLENPTKLSNDQPKTSFSKIDDLKKHMKRRTGKSQDMSSGYVDQTSGISHGSDDAVITTGHVDEVEGIKKSYVANDEEDKIADHDRSNYSRGSSSNQDISNDMEFDDETMNEDTVSHLFDHSDSNFFDEDDEDMLKTPFGNIGLGKISEEEELFDEDAIELKHKRERIKDIEESIKEKWEQLVQDDDYDAVKK